MFWEPSYIAICAVKGPLKCRLAYHVTCSGMQMLVDDIGDVTTTNDGATILKLLEVEHPAAKARPGRLTGHQWRAAWRNTGWVN